MIDHEIRINNGVLRVKSLGRDRYWNRYYWYDGGLGAYPIAALTKGIELQRRPDQRAPKEETLRDWASGCIFVEDFGLQDVYDSNQTDDQKIIRILLGQEIGNWGYYSQVLEIESLLKWMDTRGTRELALKNNIESVHDLIVAGMKCRLEVFDFKLGS